MSKLKMGSATPRLARRREVDVPDGDGALVAAAAEGGDWRTELFHNTRQRIVKKMFETFKTHVPVYEPEGQQELNRIAVRFEAKIYAEATSRSDYLIKISQKMLTVVEVNPPQHPSFQSVSHLSLHMMI